MVFPFLHLSFTYCCFHWRMLNPILQSLVLVHLQLLASSAKYTSGVFRLGRNAMDITKRSAGRVPLRVNYRIAAIKLTIVLDILNIYNLKLFSLWYMQFLKWFLFLMQRISSLKHDILCFPIMSTLKVTWPEVPTMSTCIKISVSREGQNGHVLVDKVCSIDNDWQN